MAEQDNWKQPIVIQQFGGLVPAYYKTDYPVYGNSNQASDMVDCDISDPNGLKPSLVLESLIGGTDQGSVTTLIRSILRYALADNITCAIGGTMLYPISATTVFTPHTILQNDTTPNSEDGEDVVYFKGVILYSYNFGGNAGDIGVLSDGTYDDDWGSTLGYGGEGGGVELEYGPHQMINGGDDQVFIANGHYVAVISNDTILDPHGLDFWEDSEVASLSWNSNRVVIAVNRPNLSGANFSQSGIYYWNGATTSWEGDPIEVSGRIGALYTKNGVTFVWWQDSADSLGYNFGYIDGSVTHQIKRFEGSLPLYYQVGEENGLIVWVSGQNIIRWGSEEADLATEMSNYMTPEYATVGGIGAPFGELMVASTDETNYTLSKQGTTYSTAFSWTSKAFRVNGSGINSQLDIVEIETDPLPTGTVLQVTMYYNKNQSSVVLGTIDNTDGTNTKTKHLITNRLPQVEDFMIKIEQITP